MTELVRRVAGVVPLPVVVYPNAGGDWDSGTATWAGAAGDADVWPSTVDDEWLAAGAVGIGGCCGTDDRFVRAIADGLAGRAP